MWDMTISLEQLKQHDWDAPAPAKITTGHQVVVYLERIH